MQDHNNFNVFTKAIANGRIEVLRVLLDDQDIISMDLVSENFAKMAGIASKHNQDEMLSMLVEWIQSRFIHIVLDTDQFARLFSVATERDNVPLLISLLQKRPDSQSMFDIHG